MNSDKSFDKSPCAGQMRLAERELKSFIGAVRELFGPEQARLSADDWLDESELMDVPRSTSREWRAVTVAASARLAGRLTVARDRRALAASTDTKVPRSGVLKALRQWQRDSARRAQDSRELRLVCQ